MSVPVMQAKRESILSNILHNKRKEKKRIRWKHRITYRIGVFCLVFLFALFPVSARASQAQTLNPGVNDVIKKVRSYMLSVDTNPDYSSIWNVLGMSRCNSPAPATYIDTFYNNVIRYMDEKDWVLTNTKYTEYSKLIISLTSMGKDVRNIAGHNLFAYLSDFTNVKRQGFNGPVWALIALKCHPSYSIPIDSSAKEQTTEEGLIQYILDGEKAGGGWALSGNVADSDVTGMTIQALSSYYGKREDVTFAVDRALTWLSANQNKNGGYATMGTETAESIAQVIVALTSIGIDPGKDERFIKNGKWPMSRLYDFYVSPGGFMHVLPDSGNNGGGAAGQLNGLATEQGMYACVAYQRIIDGKTALYDMSDVSLSAGTRPAGTGAGNSSTVSGTTSSGTTASKKKVTKVVLDYSAITITKGKTRKLSVSVYPSTASSKKVKWSSSNKKVATVTQKGTVKGIKKGTATVTVKAQDGSGKKASCKITVTEPSTTEKKSSATTTARTTAVPVKRTVSQSTTAVRKPTGTTSKNATATTATKKSDGWSFDGADYIPENGTSSDDSDELSSMDDGNTDKKGSWMDKTITLHIPLGAITYIIVGAVLMLFVEALLLFIYKKRRKR